MAKMWKQLKDASTNEGIKKMRYVHIMESLLFSFKKKDILQYATT